MQNKIIKKATPLSFAFTLLIGTLSFNSQATEISDLFLSKDDHGSIALNGVRGKPPYNRKRMRSQRQKSLKLVEMSALETSQGMSSTPASEKKFRRGGHPDRNKLRTSRY